MHSLCKQWVCMRTRAREREGRLASAERRTEDNARRRSRDGSITLIDFGTRCVYRARSIERDSRDRTGETGQNLMSSQNLCSRYSNASNESLRARRFTTSSRDQIIDWPAESR